MDIKLEALSCQENEYNIAQNKVQLELHRIKSEPESYYRQNAILKSLSALERKIYKLKQSVLNLSQRN